MIRKLRVAALSRSKAHAALSLFLLIVLSGCGSTLHSTITLQPLVPPQKPEEPLEIERLDTFIYIDQLIDARPDKAVAVIDGREVDPANDVVQVVVAGIEKALAKKGFQFSDTAPVIISGEIRNWVARIEGGFTKRITSDSELYVEVRDPADRRVYSGVYRGYSSRETAGLSEQDVQDVLRTSMTEAISQVTNDTQLVKLLSSY